MSDFETFFRANEGRIHYQIQRLGVSGDLYEELYAEGIVALWKAYESFDEQKGNIGTYLNYQIRYRLLDVLRKKSRQNELKEEAEGEEKVRLDDGNRHGTSGLPLIRPDGVPLSRDAFWIEVRRHLTNRQWKWVEYFIIANLSVQEIAEIEGVSTSAVKSWGMEVRRKLRKKRVLERLLELL